MLVIASGERVPSTKNAMILARITVIAISLRAETRIPKTNIIQVPINKPVALRSIRRMTGLVEVNITEIRCLPMQTDKSTTQE